MTHDAKLKCPTCGSTGSFRVVAEKWIKVLGSDYTEVVDEEGDLEYGSESACRCCQCHHQAPMGEFYDQTDDEEGDDDTDESGA